MLISTMGISHAQIWHMNALHKGAFATAAAIERRLAAIKAQVHNEQVIHFVEEAEHEAVF